MDVNKINKQAATATRWSVITESMVRLISPVVSMALARLLTPEAFGVVATVTLVVSFADMFTDAGFQKYLIQHDFTDNDELDQYTNVAFWTNMAISVCLWLLVWLWREQVAALIGSPGTGAAIVVAALSLPLTAFSSIQTARFRRIFDFKSLFYFRMISACVPLVVTLPLAFLLRSYWAMIVGTLLNNVINAVILTWKSSWKPKLYFNVSALKSMFSYSWWILLESVTNWISSNIGVFIVGVYLSNHYVGLYKSAMSTVSQIMNIIIAATSAPLFSALSRLKNDRAALTTTYTNFIHGIGMFLFPLGAGIWLYRDLVTYILLGKQWMEVADFVGLWGLFSAIVLVLGTYCNGLYNAVEKTKLSFFAQILHIAAVVPVLLWSAPRGFQSLWISRCLVRLELVLVQLIIMKLCMKMPIWRLVKGLLPAVSATAVMMVFAFLMRILGDSTAWQICSIAICIVVYFGACMLFWKKELLSAFRIFGIHNMG